MDALLDRGEPSVVLAGVGPGGVVLGGVVLLGLVPGGVVPGGVVLIVRLSAELRNPDVGVVMTAAAGGEVPRG